MLRRQWLNRARAASRRQGIFAPHAYTADAASINGPESPWSGFLSLSRTRISPIVLSATSSRASASRRRMTSETSQGVARVGIRLRTRRRLCPEGSSLEARLAIATLTYLRDLYEALRESGSSSATAATSPQLAATSSRYLPFGDRRARRVREIELDRLERTMKEDARLAPWSRRLRDRSPAAEH